MWTLGLALWMFERDRQPLVDWLKAKFAKNAVLADANIAALNAGHAYGETAELSGPLKQHQVQVAPVDPCRTVSGRTVTGAEAISLGLVAGAQLAQCFRCSSAAIRSHPPRRSCIICSRGSRNIDVTTFQAEDEIAAIASAIGASYAGLARHHLLLRVPALR